MFIFVAVGAGVLCYFLHIMCLYDLEPKRDSGRSRYFFHIDKERGMVLCLSMLLCAGLTWLFVQYQYGPLKIVRYLLLLSFLYSIALEDAREKTIPNKWLIYILFCRLILFLAEIICFPELWMEDIRFILLGGSVSGAIFFIAYVLSGHAIGMGDVKLFAVIGMCLGVRTTYLVMLLSLILSAIYGGSMVLRKKKGMKDEIAFAPFIGIGTLIALLIGA